MFRPGAALAAGIRNLDATALLDAVAMAAGIGYSNQLVEDAKAALEKVQGLTERCTAAANTMDPASHPAGNCAALNRKPPAAPISRDCATRTSFCLEIEAWGME